MVYIFDVLKKYNTRYNKLFLIIAFIVTCLITVQVYWISNSIKHQRIAANKSLEADFEKLAKEIEEEVYCYKIYSKSFLKTGEGVYLMKFGFDTLTKKVLYADTLNMFNFHVFDNDTLYENYPTIDMARFSSTLDATFNFSFEGIKDNSAYSISNINGSNLYEAFDNTYNMSMLEPRFQLEQKIKKVLSANNYDSGFVACIKKELSPDYDIVTGNISPEFLSSQKTIDIPFLKGRLNTPYMLSIYVPDSFRKTISSMSVMMGTSVVIIILLVIAFIYFIKIILDQERLSEMKDNFISNITHEFKTPITNINLAVDNWKDTRSREAFYFDIIKQENEHLNKNVEQVLQLAALEKSDIPLDFERIDVHQLLHNTIDTFDMQLKNAGIDLKMSLDAEQSLIIGDERLLLNMVYNLIDNSIKYRSSKPVIKLSTANKEERLLIVIEDNGIGMDAETIKHIFNRFYRHTKGDRHDIKGFGLGLSYVKYIVEQHKGNIQVKSKVDKGTSFFITLPLNTIA